MAESENPGARASRGRPRSAPRRASGERGQRTGLVQFVHECWAELGRVQWPNRVQLWQATAVVIIVCIVIGAYIAALDSILARVSKWLVDEYARH